jgi:hypothetical protein
VEQAYSAAAPPAARDLPAVRALRLILLQQFYRETGAGGEKVTWREDGTHGLPPGRARIVSPYDLDAVRRVVAHSECACRLEGRSACGLAA